jgi:GGDEF domain-containing protein
LAECLRTTASAELCRDPELCESLAISIGVAQYDPARHDTGEALVAVADAQLYAAKEAGRDQVCVEDSD